ncbi:DUF4920 domain-containing protein [candidate division KSB1 bacterium]
MNRKRSFFCIAAVLALSLIMSASLFAQDEKKAGAELTIKEVTQITDILDAPEKYVGINVLIKGTVVDMCVKRGGWMDLAGDKPFTKFKVDGRPTKVLFPLDSTGKTALVEGTIVQVIQSVEEQKELLKHNAEIHGEEVDLSVIKGPKKIYQVNALGAVIKQK